MTETECSKQKCGPVICLVTNYCPHYRLPVFEALAHKYDTLFLFTHEGPGDAGWNNYGDLVYQICENKLQLLKKLWLRQFDLIIAGFPTWTSLIEYIVCKVRGKKILWWSEEWFLPQTTLRKVAMPILRYIARRADFILCMGTPQIRNLAENYHVPVERLGFAPNVSMIEESASEKNGAFSLQIPAGKKIILYLGRLVRYKGADLLIKAFSRIEKEPGNVFLIVAGDGPYRSHVESLAQRMLTAGSYAFVGAVPFNQRLYWLRQCDIFVLPSIFQKSGCEAWGLTLNEAMQCGKPVITTDAVGAAEDLVHGKQTGIIVRSGDPVQLYSALRLLLDDDSMRAKMGANARRLIYRHFTYQDLVQSFENAIKKIWNGRGAKHSEGRVEN